MQRPDNEVPVCVPVHGVLNRTPDVAIALTSTLVFSTGLEWRIEAYKRLPTGTPMGGHGFGRWETSSSPAMLFGVEFSDGSFASNMPGGSRMTGGLFNISSRSGGRQRIQTTLRLDRHPTPGPFTIVTMWPFYGVPEAHVAFDADLILNAAPDVQRLWDPIPPGDGRDEQIARLDPYDRMLVIPRTGWFGEHFEPPRPQEPHLDERGRQRIYIAYGGDDADSSPVTHRSWRMADQDGPAPRAASSPEDTESDH